jgi:hypothetical protein
MNIYIIYNIYYIIILLIGILDVENLDKLQNEDDFSESEEETPVKDHKRRERRKRVILQDGTSILVSRHDKASEIGVDIKNKKKSKPIGLDRIQSILNKVNSNVSTINKSSSNLSPKAVSHTSNVTQMQSKVDLTNSMNEIASTDIINMDDSNSNNNGKSNNLDKDIKKIVRVVKPKPIWDPNDEIIQAINKFKSIINEKYSNGKIIGKKDKDLPVEVEALLLKVDKVVFKSFGNSILKFSGYLESLIDILGGESVIKSRKLQCIIYKIRNRDELEITNKTIIETLTLFQSELKNLITESPPQVINSIPNNDNIIDKSENNINKVSNNTSDIIIENSSMDITIDSIIEKVTEPSVKIPIYYKYQCKWNQKLKGFLLLLEELTMKRIKLENSYLEMLSPLQKVDVVILNDKKEMTNIIRTISELFPESCSNSDSISIRHKLSVEKSRLKKLSAVNNPSSSSVGSIAVLKHEMKKKIIEGIKSPNKLNNNPSSTINNSTPNRINKNTNKFALKKSHPRVIYEANKIYEYNMSNNISNELNVPKVGNVFKEINYNVEDFKCFTE